jgi:hypothetical protein
LKSARRNLLAADFPDRPTAGYISPNASRRPVMLVLELGTRGGIY